LSKGGEIKSWRGTNGIGRKTVMIPRTKETNGGRKGERKMRDDQNDGDSGYIGNSAAASSHPYGAFPEDGCYRGRPKGLVVHVK